MSLRVLASRLRLRFLADRRLRSLKDDWLRLVLAIHGHGEIRALLELADDLGNDTRLLAEGWLGMASLEWAGLLEIEKRQGEQRCRASASAAEKARAELARREAKWDGPGPRLGSRSRESGLAMRLA